MAEDSVLLVAEGLGGPAAGPPEGSQATLPPAVAPSGPGASNSAAAVRVFEEWRNRAAEEFFELTDVSMPQIMRAFDLLMLGNAEELDLLASVKLVSICARQISVPQYTDRFYSRLVSTSAASSASASASASALASGAAGQRDPRDPHAPAGDVGYYVELVNGLLPYLAAESVYSASLALALLPRLALYLTDEQLLDLITNVSTSLEVFSAVPNGSLPACSAGLCLYSLATECIPQADHLHAGAVIALRACVKAASSFSFLAPRKDSGVPDVGEEVTRGEPLTDDEGTVSAVFCQRLFCAIVSKMIKSTRLDLLSRVDDVDIIVSIVADLYALLRKRKLYDELALVLVIHALYEPNMLQCLIRVPNYMGGFLSYCSSILFSRNRSCNIANACRGFLTSCLLIDSFLTSSAITEDEVATIIDVLKSDLSDEDNVLALKGVIETCYDNYLHNFHVPVRAIKPLNFSLALD